MQKRQQDYTDVWFAQMMLEEMEAGREAFEEKMAFWYPDESRRQTAREMIDKVVAEYAADCETSVSELRGW